MNYVVGDIDLSDDFFGAVLNCAVRYSLGRQSYIPSLVMDFIAPLLPSLSKKTLWCFDKDIKAWLESEKEASYHTPADIVLAWQGFHVKVKQAIYEEKKTENPCDGCYWLKVHRHQKCSCCRRNKYMKDNYTKQEEANTGMTCKEVEIIGQALSEGFKAGIQSVIDKQKLHGETKGQ